MEPPGRRPLIPIDDAREMALVKAIREGKTAAWSELLIRYQDRLFGVCLRMVGNRDRAADYTQDAMVRILEGLASYDGRSKLSTWMIRVTMNVCFSRLRAEKLRRHVSLDAGSNGHEGRGGGRGGGGGGKPRSASERVSDWEHREPAAADRVQMDELRRQLAEALLRISPEQRAILVLRDSRGLDYEQIAEVLDVPVGTVKSRLFRARTALREVLEGMEGSPGKLTPAPVENDED